MKKHLVPVTVVSGGFPAVRRGRRWCAELRRGRRRAAAAAAAAWQRRRRWQCGGVLPIPWRGESGKHGEKPWDFYGKCWKLASFTGL